MEMPRVKKLAVRKSARLRDLRLEEEEDLEVDREEGRREWAQPPPRRLLAMYEEEEKAIEI